LRKQDGQSYSIGQKDFLGENRKKVKWLKSLFVAKKKEDNKNEKLSVNKKRIGGKKTVGSELIEKPIIRRAAYRNALLE